MSTELVFVVGQKLLWVTEAVISIYNYAAGGSAKKGKESKRRKDAVSACVKSLIEMWSKAFGSENIMERKALANKSEMDWHCISVTFITDSQLSRREQVKQWRQLPEVNQLLDILKKISKPEVFREDEKNFFINRKKLPELVI